MNPESNVFEALQKYGSHAPENYLTEAFVYLLDLLLIREPAAGLEMINQLCGLSGLEQLTQAGAISIDTQVKLDKHGIVDIQIQSDENALFYVEVKLDSPLDGSQLKLYQDHLNQAQGHNRKGLIFLSRSHQGAIPAWLKPEEYHRACWYEVYDWIQKLNVHDEIVRFFAANFRSFLENRGMCFRQVSADYVSDTTAMENLMLVLKSAIGEAIPGADPKLPRNPVLYGYNVWRFFCGIRLNTPDLLVFEDNNGRSPDFRRTLNLANENLYARDKGAQFEQIVQFLRKSYDESLKFHH